MPATDDDATSAAARCVLIVDDHALVRLGLAAVLLRQRRPIRVLEAENGVAALACLVANPAVHLIVFDWSLPLGGGLAGLSALQQQAPGVPVLVMSGHDAQVYGIAAASAGAEFLSKNEAAERVRETLERLLAHPPVAIAQPPGAALPKLTARQCQVLPLLAQGWPNKRIARQLGLSEHTVNAHASEIYRRLGVSNRTEAGRFASRLGLAEPPDGGDGRAG